MSEPSPPPLPKVYNRQHLPYAYLVRTGSKKMDVIENQPIDREEVDLGQSPVCDGERQGEGQERPRKRARLSCNTCKARKTKVSSQNR